MRLGHRLQAVADLVEPCGCVADIGTDHAYLALALVQSGKAGHVIASDVHRGPFEAACRTVMAAGASDCIEVRLGDGLKPLSPGEAEAICIAGMGGQLMKRLLADSSEMLQAVRQIVVQPMNDGEELRHWLYASGWHLEEETLAEEDGRLYEILSAKRGEREMPAPVLLQVGPILWERKPPLLRRHLENLLEKARRARDGMARSPRARESGNYRSMEQRIKELEGMLLW